MPLTAGQLRARRAAQRRRRRRNRLGALAGILIAAAAIFGVTRLFTSATSPGSGTATAASAHSHGGHGAGGGAADHRRRRRATASEARRIRAQGTRQRVQVERVLAYTPYARIATRHRREVALTFDDGPGLYTSKFMAILKREHVPATFFTVGWEVRARPHLVEDEARDGDEVGDHTESHAYLQEVSPAEQRDQIEDGAEAIHHAGAPYPVLFRPPYGSFNAITMRLLHAQKMLMVLWSVDTSDYARPGVSRIVDSALSGATSGSIILMHDGGGDRSETAAALPQIIRGLRRRHFRLVTVSQLVASDPPPRHQPPPQPLSGLG